MNPERIILNDANDPGGAFLPLADVRDRFTAPVRAVVDYSFGNFKFLALNNPPLADGGLRPEQTRRRGRDELAVACYNVENLDGADPQERFDRVADQIVGNLRSPDILSLEEIQDNDGAATRGADGGATLTHARLIDAIVAAGGPTLRLPADRPGVQHRRRRAGRQHPRLVPVPHRRPRPALRRPAGRDRDDGDRAGRRPAAARGSRSARAGSTRPNPVFNSSRKPLAGEFRYRGRPLFVVGNHFNSKGGDDPLFGRFQEPRRSSELQRRGSATDPPTPRGQAGCSTASCAGSSTSTRAPAWSCSATSTTSTSRRRCGCSSRARARSGPELVNLWRLLPRARALLLHLPGQRAGPGPHPRQPGAAAPRPAGLRPVHINAEFSDQASDHDPPIVRFELAAELPRGSSSSASTPRWSEPGSRRCGPR